jgi:hypothetical protein
MSCRGRHQSPINVIKGGANNKGRRNYERKPNPEPLTSGDSDFESATGSPALEPTRNLIDTIEGGPQVETEQT